MTTEPGSSGIDVASLGEMMAAYAQDAVEHARANGVTLDYSDESIRGVETILGRLHGERPRSLFARLLGRGPSEQQLWTVCKMYGGYVGEVVRRSRGGEWAVDTDVAPGEQVIALRRPGGVIFPPSKVYKRLTNGAEDDVWAYFQVLVKERWK